jgi:hypothetical protein
MIIHPPEMITKEGEIKISARIETRKPIPNFPDTLWFSFPETYQPYITPRSEAFLLPMLVPAMHFNEDIDVRGTISPKLAMNLKEFIYIYHQAFKLHRVDFSTTELKAFETQGKPEAVLLSFSGGADSMFSLYSNLPENQPIKEAQGTHGLLIHGFSDFDIALKDTAYFKRVYSRYRNLFENLGLELLIGKTNAYHFSKFRIDWEIGYTPTMVAFAYLLSNLVKTFYRASDETYIKIKLYAPWLMSNHMLSNETFDVVSHSASYGRAKKLEGLASWPPSYDDLRVCQAWDKKDVDLNCSRCWKCLGTMILLNILGTYDRFISFDQPYNRSTLFRFFFQLYPDMVSASEIIRTAKKYRRFGILIWSYLFYYPNKFRTWLLKKIDHALSNEQKYRIRERFFGKRDFDSPHSG